MEFEKRIDHKGNAKRYDLKMGEVMFHGNY